MADYSWIGPLVSGVLKGFNSSQAANSANGQIQAAYDEILRNWRERMGDYDAMGEANYRNISPELLGPSALENIPVDLMGRQAQQESMSALDDLSAHGGLSLADMQALNQVQGNLNRNDTARRKGLANEFAARGQLGSGAQLAMAMQGQQDAAMNANQRGEDVSAQAQQRALQAILQKGQMARAMGNDDYARRSAAAQARDAIEARNAAARMGAAQANNSIAGQKFADTLAKAHGKTSLTNSMNKAIFGKGEQGARNTAAQAGYTNDLIDQGGGLLSRAFSNNSGNGGSGGVSDAEANNLTSLSSNPYPEDTASSPDEWNEYPGGDE